MKGNLKKLLAIGLSLAMLAGISGCGKTENAGGNSAGSSAGSETEPGSQETASSGSQEGAVHIGVSLDNLDDPFWVGIKKGIDAAQEELGAAVTIDVQIAQGDANMQNKQIEDMLTAGAEAIVCVYVDKEAITQSVTLCNEKNVPFIYADRKLESTDDAQVAWGVATDDTALSVSGWEYMVGYAKENDIQLKVLELVGSLTDENVLKRTEGFETVREQNSDVVELVQQVPTEFNLEKALAGVTNALQANPDINCIFMHSDYLLAPTIQALEQADRYKKIGEEGHIILMPYSGNALSLETMESGYTDMCFGMDVYNEGYQSIMAAYDLAQGKTEGYGEPLLDPGFIINQDNLAENGARAYGALS